MAIYRTSLLLVIFTGALLVIRKCDGMAVDSLHIRSDIASRFATTQITSDVRNTDSEDREVFFNVVLPKEAFITNFSMTIDNEVFQSTVKEKAQAKKQYQTAKKKGQSAGLVEQQGRDSNKFKISVNVAGNTTVTFKLSYQELLRRQFGLYDHVIHLEPGQVVPDMKVDVFITESRKISDLKPPILQAEDKTKRNVSQSVINWLSESEVHIGYYPSESQQAAVSGNGLSGLRFVVRYDVERTYSAGEVMAVDGYFVHFVAPKGLKPIPKTIIFVLDSSSSMSGTRIAQMKTAMLAILKDLRPVDKFNIIDFDNNMKKWNKKMMPVTPKTVKMAKDFVSRMRADGSTNISGAMEKALDMLKKDKSGGVPMIMFLTDGHPSVGIQDPESLADAITGWNDRGVRVMCLAFGQGASYSLLQKIAGRNHGVARKIYEDADATLQLEGFYDEVSTPILSEVKINYLGDSVDTVTTTDFNILFEGSEIVVAGKLSEASSPTFDLSLQANVAEGNIVLDETFETRTPVGKPSSGSELARYTERLWAYLTIKQLLERQILANATEQLDIKEKVTSLSLKYGFVTPFTSLVVTKPDKTKRADQSATDAPKTQPKPKSPWKPNAGYADNDPHFVVSLQGIDYPICFDVMGQDGDVFKLVSDPVSGVEVDGKVFTPNPQHKKTYFWAITVKTKQYTMKVTPKVLMVDRMKLSWRENMMIRWHGRSIGFMGKNNLTLHVTNDTDFVIMRHHRTLKKGGEVDFLGFYLNDAVGLSNQTMGLLGEFRHRTVISTDYPPVKNGRLHANIGLLNLLTSSVDVVTAMLRHRPDLEHDTVLSCWEVKDGVLSNSTNSYVVRRKHSQIGK